MPRDDQRPPSHLNHFRRPEDLADGDAVNRDARGCVYLTVIAGSGATVTVSRVAGMDAAAHGTGAFAVDTVAAGTRETYQVDWPYLRISVAGGTASFALG